MLATISALLLAGAGLTAAAAVPTVPVPNVQKRQSAGGSCSSPEFAPVTVVGGAGTASFCESSWGTTYLPITNLTVWSNDALVTGIQATYSDGSQSGVYGYQAAVAEKSIGVNYGINDLWSRVSMYSRSSVHVLHLYLGTSNGDVSNSGENVASDPYLTRFDQDVGSGLLFGVQGTTASNGDIASLGFLFIESPISTIEINNLAFPDGPIGTDEDINPSDIGEAHFINSNTDASVTYQFNNQLSETNTFAFAQAYTSTFTVMEQISFMFGIMFLIVTGGSESTTFVWTSTQMETTTNTIAQMTQVQYNAAVTLGPGEEADCVAVAGQGSGTFPYTSTVTITLKNGNKYSFEEDGALTVDYISQGIVQCSGGTVAQ